MQVEQGALYLYNDDDENNPYLTLVASYAPDEKRLIGRRLEMKLPAASNGVSSYDLLISRLKRLGTEPGNNRVNSAKPIYPRSCF
jgi:hypothetical protein